MLINQTTTSYQYMSSIMYDTYMMFSYATTLQVFLLLYCYICTVVHSLNQQNISMF